MASAGYLLERCQLVIIQTKISNPFIAIISHAIFEFLNFSVARAIGIPSRIITCYSCAHDTQASLTVDYFVDKDGKILEELNQDSVWNYHVWNEVWMDRPDLSSDGLKYNGW